MNLIKNCRLHYKQISPILIIGLISIFRLPNFILVPETLLSTHNLGRLVIIVATLFILFTVKKRKSQLFILMSLLFVSLSISSLSALNIFAYLDSYKTILFIYMLFVIYYHTINKQNIIVIAQWLVILTGINISIQLLLYFTDSDPMIQYFHKTFIQFYNFNKARGRFFGEMYDEALLPILFWFYYKESNLYRKLFIFLIILGTIFLVLISGWRTKFIILLSSILSIVVYIIFKKGTYKQIAYALLVLFSFLLLLGHGFSYKNATIDRFDFSQDINTNTIQSRFIYIKEGVDLIKDHWFLGIGLGNYYDNLISSSQRAKRAYSSFSIKPTQNFIFINDPHNIIVSITLYTGFIGLLLFLAMTRFIFLRIKVILKSYSYKSFVPFAAISLINLSLFSLFNPFIDLTYLNLMIILLILVFVQ